MQEGRFGDALQHFQSYQAYAEQDNHEWSMAQAFLKLAWAYAHLGQIEQSRSSIYRCLKLLQNADAPDLELIVLLCEARCLAEEENIETAAALAALIAGHPITWNEIRVQAKALLAELTKKLDSEAIRLANRQFHGHDVRELTTKWLEEYEGRGNLIPSDPS
jgi:hypothetical protein